MSEVYERLRQVIRLEYGMFFHVNKQGIRVSMKISHEVLISTCQLVVEVVVVEAVMVVVVVLVWASYSQRL